MLEIVSPPMAREYEACLTNAQPAAMADPEAVRLMRVTHMKQPAG